MSSTQGRSLNWNKLEGNLTNILGDPGAVSRAGRKGATKVFKHRRKSPWVPTLTGLFPNGQANAGSWLGTENALYYCVQSANSFSWVLYPPWYALSSARLNGLFLSLLAKQNFKFLVFWFKKLPIISQIFVKVMINLQQNFVSSNSVCNHTRD